MRLREHLHLAHLHRPARADGMQPLQSAGEIALAQLEYRYRQADDQEVDHLDLHPLQRSADQRQVLRGETEVVAERLGGDGLLGKERVGAYRIVNALDRDGNSFTLAAQRFGQVTAVGRRGDRGKELALDPPIICHCNELGVAKTDIDTAYDGVHGRGP